jgi:hypothetical protein
MVASKVSCIKTGSSKYSYIPLTSPRQCAICGKSFAQKTNVRIHIQTHKTWTGQFRKMSLVAADTDVAATARAVVRQSYGCGFCEDVYGTNLELMNHLKNHEDQKRFRCPRGSCTELFVTISTLSEHLASSSHVGEVGHYTCTTCQSTFDDLAVFKIHQTGHDIRRDPRPWHKCSVCQTSFSTAKSLEQHVANNEHEIRCVACVKTFSSLAGIRAHRMSCHQSDLNVCRICGKSFSKKSYLK